MDDGSNDSTGELISSMSRTSPFNIVYLAQANTGKALAVNRGVKEANGEFTVIVDSDDELTADALSALWDAWVSINPEDRPSFAAVLGNSITPEGKIVGAEFPNAPVDGFHFELFASGTMRGDKLPCYITRYLQRYPYPDLQSGGGTPRPVLCGSQSGCD